MNDSSSVPPLVTSTVLLCNAEQIYIRWCCIILLNSRSNWGPGNLRYRISGRHVIAFFVMTAMQHRKLLCNGQGVVVLKVGMLRHEETPKQRDNIP